MPSVENLINGKGQGSLMWLNNQQAQIILPPLMKVYQVGENTANQITLLEAQNNIMYVIHGYTYMVKNSAATACTNSSLKVYDFWSGKLVSLEDISLVANSVNENNVRITGLNLPTYPGKPVLSYVDAAPLWRNICLYYTEVKV